MPTIIVTDIGSTFHIKAAVVDGALHIMVGEQEYVFEPEDHAELIITGDPVIYSLVEVKHGGR